MHQLVLSPRRNTDFLRKFIPRSRAYLWTKNPRLFSIIWHRRLDIDARRRIIEFSGAMPVLVRPLKASAHCCRGWFSNVRSRACFGNWPRIISMLLTIVLVKWIMSMQQLNGGVDICYFFCQAFRMDTDHCFEFNILRGLHQWNLVMEVGKILILGFARRKLQLVLVKIRYLRKPLFCR